MDVGKPLGAPGRLDSAAEVVREGIESLLKEERPGVRGINQDYSKRFGTRRLDAGYFVYHPFGGVDWRDSFMFPGCGDTHIPTAT